MFENVDGRTDDGRRTTDAGVFGILIANLGAFGSGELKMWYVNQTKTQTSLCICTVCSEPLLVA